MPVEVLLEDDSWRQVPLQALAETACAATLTHLGKALADHDISILACDDDRIATLNEDFRGKPTPTNVLSWPSLDLSAEVPGQTPDHGRAWPELGDIAIAWGTCSREANEMGKPLDVHLTHLLVHGTLHLLGYDHMRDEDATLMEALEVEILDTLGVANPYVSVGPAGPSDGTE